jgi:hypothetical protein
LINFAERRWIHNWLRVALVASQCEFVGLWAITIVQVVSHLNIACKVITSPKIVHLVEDLFGLIVGIACRRNENGTLRECANGEGSDNTEIVTSSSESKVEVRLIMFSDGCDGTIGKNNLKSS